MKGKVAYSDGSIKARWEGKFEPDGRYELNGLERWYYQDGKKAYEVTYEDGNKRGLETYWSPEGQIIWQWDHRADDDGVWTHYWSNGQKRQQSEWHGEVASGPAVLWDESGQVIGRYQFKDGIIAQ